MSVQNAVRGLGLLLMSGGMVQLLASVTANANALGKPAVIEPALAHMEMGIAPQLIRLSAAGYMLDFRYRVLEVERAAEFINKATQPYIIDEADGVKLGVPSPPKIGPLRHTGGHLVEGKTYFILFANPARRVQRGDRVTVVLGEKRIEHIVVQ